MNTPRTHSGVNRYSRGLQVVLAIVLVAAISGYFIGLRETATSTATVSSFGDGRHGEPVSQGPVLAAVDYRSIGALRQQQRSVTQSTVSDLPVPSYEIPESDFAAVSSRDAEAVASVVQARAGRRAFDGAPPTVPHSTNQMDSAACLSCHEKGRVIGPLTAPRMCHEMFVSCAQCHVEQIAAMPGVVEQPSAAASNSFVGLSAAVVGDRAFTGAPPVIPHPVWMRSDCLSCHGPAGVQPMQTSHPWRQSCVQCHVIPAGDAGAPVLADSL